MKKRYYLKPAIEELPIAAVPLMEGSAFEEGKTDTGGGIHDDEVDDGWSRRDRNAWDDEEDLRDDGRW